MKKIISLVLAMVLCLTSISAFAAGSPVAQQTFLIDTSLTESKTDGITVTGNLDKSIDFTNRVINGRKAVSNIGNISIGKPIIFVDDKIGSIENPELSKAMTNYAIVPFPQFTVGEDVADEIAKFITPITPAVKDFMLDNMDRLAVFFMYEKPDAIKIYEVAEWYIIATGRNTYGILCMIPVSVLRDAQGCPVCLDFEIINK